MTDIPLSVLSEAARLLFAGDNPPEEIKNDIKRVYARLREAETVRKIYRIFPVEAAEDGIVIDGSLKIEGSDLAKLCRNCKKVILMAATLGANVDRLINQMMLNDLADATILDACASADIERVLDETESEIFKSLTNEFLTMRFSPGYGDVPLEESAKIIDALQTAKKIGVSATKGSMHIPIKSVTAIIGISDRPENRMKSCAYCAVNGSCEYRKKGEFCGVRNK